MTDEGPTIEVSQAKLAALIRIHDTAKAIVEEGSRNQPDPESFESFARRGLDRLAAALMGAPPVGINETDDPGDAYSATVTNIGTEQDTADASADPTGGHGRWTGPFHPSEVPQTDAVLTAIIDDLGDWWHNTAESDFAQMQPKIGEYTSSDLVLMGQFMEHWLGLPAGSGAEAATLWYALGKVARAVAAYREGRLPSEDTLHDLSVYAMMARRIRESGRWP